MTVSKSSQGQMFKRIIDLGKVSTAEVDDLVRIWRVGTGDEKAITLTNFVATVNADLGTSGLTLTEIIEELEPAFLKGNVIQGDGVNLTGTLTERLVGDGDIVISTDGQVPTSQAFTYSSSNVFSLSFSSITPIYVSLNGQLLREGGLYDWTISGSSLTVSTPLRAGDEISILYYVDLPVVTTYARNIDGGTWDSVYLPIQNVDGGGF